ncbi:hypothetical protein AB0F03_37395 [Streptomyces sp. NPDC028722]
MTSLIFEPALAGTAQTPLRRHSGTAVRPRAWLSGSTADFGFPSQIA